MIVMKRLQAFKFQLRPNGQQERDMRRFAGLVASFLTVHWHSRMRTMKRGINIFPTPKWLHGSLRGNPRLKHNG
ncbi:helix-turn-helix domain-containing protein [Xylella fastidiosa]|uniref:helix-turn-helix domain-containing protein n=1 Tax=Xylella fastidiosa TaxID=2371 RepID=UPI003CCFDD75